MNKQITYFLILFLISGIAFFSFPRCANIIPPTGGPRDTIPPKVVRSVPVNYSTRITDIEILIEFDEFIQLRNINQQFIITPPQKERPDFRARGRNLFINLNTDLIPNTTYTLNFGEAIADLNEGNVLRNYEFVFSTGDIIDSLRYSGVVLNAFDNKPVEGVIVMLYDNLVDSVPFGQMPLYATRTNKEGLFRLNNLRADTFKVFALKDANNNYLYDRRDEEEIAFLSEYIHPGYQWIQLPSMAYPVNDSAGIRIDAGLETDDAGVAGPEPGDSLPVFQFRSGDTLYLFKEEAGRQYISRNERSQRGELLFVFNRPVQGDWSIEPLNFEPPENWKLVEINPDMDSIRYWITDPQTRSIDNMRFLASFWATGPSDSLKLRHDSINMNFTDQVRSRRLAATDESESSMEISFRPSAGGNQELNRNLKISFPVPLAITDISKTNLYTFRNNQLQEHAFELKQDSLRIRDHYLATGWIPGEDYKFFASPGAFTDIFGLSSDTVDLTFKTREEDHYGRILLNIEGVDDNIIIQLISEKDLVIGEYFTEKDTGLIMDFLQPQKYRLKAIFDRNNNNRWDTGNYISGIQPERVIFYRDIIAVRPNWDIEIEWQLQQASAP